MKHKAKYIPLLFALTGVLLLTGCGNKNSMTGKTDYIKFLGDQFSVISTNLQGLKTALSGFSEEKLADATWVSKINGKLDKVDQSISDIVSYEAVPDDFADFHNKVKDMAYQLKLAVASYKTGIEQKDYSTLQTANDQMQSTAAAMKERLGDIKSFVETQ